MADRVPVGGVEQPPREVGRTRAESVRGQSHQGIRPRGPRIGSGLIGFDRARAGIRDGRGGQPQAQRIPPPGCGVAAELAPVSPEGDRGVRRDPGRNPSIGEQFGEQGGRGGIPALATQSDRNCPPIEC
jgi:hypothetical protein